MLRWEAGGKISINHNIKTFMQITRKTSLKLTDRFICLWKLKWLRHSLNFSNNYWRKKIGSWNLLKDLLILLKKIVNYFLHYRTKNFSFFPSHIDNWAQFKVHNLHICDIDVLQLQNLFIFSIKFIILKVYIIFMFEIYIGKLIIMTIFSMKGSKVQ